MRITNRCYSVKSGYQLWVEQNLHVDNIPQTRGQNKIWRLSVSHKIKIFLWGFCRNTVPVQNHLNKGMIPPITCAVCSQDIEHMLHVFFDCPFASQCWLYMGKVYNIREVEVASE